MANAREELRKMRNTVVQASTMAEEAIGKVEANMDIDFICEPDTSNANYAYFIKLDHSMDEETKVKAVKQLSSELTDRQVHHRVMSDKFPMLIQIVIP